ncbi:hypothetical protein [Bifidobacterium simiarum]|uniref:Uncharacterized protein n=1 Tax=Bifidobacterium simiarum TaxID=2045441 RepID=A0A2M9HDS0_9BIFI|nr:hypothetical protein [Bifidobacterium simiarum]PJM74952.1 hypothetical protein CSQ87_06880 [Bifidobacterium simiarum]
MMKRLSSRIAALVCVTMIFTMTGCGQSNDSQSAQASEEQIQKAKTQWSSALYKATDSQNDLKTAITDANDLTRYALDSSVSELQSTINAAYKVYTDTTIDSSEPSGSESSDAEAYTTAAEELDKIADDLEKRTTSLNAAVEAYRKSLPSLSYTITSNEGYTYDVSINGLDMRASIDTEQGKPGTVTIDSWVADTLDITIANTTPGKEAPVDWRNPDSSNGAISFGNLVPLYDTNLCTTMGQTNPLITDATCRSYSIGGKTYWDYYDSLFMVIAGQNSTVRSTAKFSVGESVSGMLVLDVIYNPNEKTGKLTKTSKQDVSEQVADSIRKPVGWAFILSVEGGSANTPYNAGANLERAVKHDLWGDDDYYILAKTKGL